jgi:hypothetical protein
MVGKVNKFNELISNLQTGKVDNKVKKIAILFPIMYSMKKRFVSLFLFFLILQS